MVRIATVKPSRIYFAIASILLIPIVCLVTQLSGKDISASMYFHVYGYLIYPLIYLGWIPLVFKYGTYLSNKGTIICLLENKILILGKIVKKIENIELKNTNIFGPRIDIYFDGKKEVFYQFFLNETVSDVERAINKISG
jgi:hypothetical protein